MRVMKVSEIYFWRGTRASSRRFGTPWDDGDAAGASPRWRGLRRRVGPYIRRAGSRRRHLLRRPGTSFRADARPPPAPAPAAGRAGQRSRRRAAGRYRVGGGPRPACRRGWPSRRRSGAGQAPAADAVPGRRPPPPPRPAGAGGVGPCDVSTAPSESARAAAVAGPAAPATVAAPGPVGMFATSRPSLSAPRPRSAPQGLARWESTTADQYNPTAPQRWPELHERDEARRWGACPGGPVLAYLG